MTSYLQQFNYQFIRGQNLSCTQEDIGNKNLTRWIFLHGLMGSGMNWRRIAQSLTSNDIAFVFDQRGHGKSVKPQSNYGAEDYAEDLELLRQEIGWDNFILVGHSMGARNALVYAHRFALHVDKLVIEDIGPEAKPEAINYYEGLLNAIPTPFLSKKAAKEWLLNEFLETPFGKSGGTNLSQYLYTNLIEFDHGVDWRFYKFGIIESVRRGRALDHWDKWQNLKMPTLLIRGEYSKDLSQNIYQKMLQLNPQVKGVELKGAGHWVHFDVPLEFIKTILDFVHFDKVST